MIWVSKNKFIGNYGKLLVAKLKNKTLTNL